MNFAPLPELVAAPDNENLDQETKQKFRAVLAERYLAAENFAQAKKYITDPGRLELVRRLEKLTGDNSGGAREKAQRMLELGDAWAEARGVLLRAPLDTELHNGYPVPGLMRRENGHALRLTNVEDQLDDRDELHHASRWWMRAARTLPGMPVAAKARLEALPQIARVSSYTEQRAREIKLEAVSREICDKLRAESPSSPEAGRFAAYWSVPPVPKQNDQMPSGLSESDQTELVTCGEQTAFGYPISDNNAFDALRHGNSEGEEQERSRVWQDIEKRMAVLRNASATTEVTELA